MAGELPDLLQAIGYDPDTFAALAGELGFGAADAGRRAGRVGRNLDLGHDMLALSGERERENIDRNFENRGTLRSSARNRAHADQRAGEAQRGTALDLAAADDLSDIDAGLQRYRIEDEMSRYADEQSYLRDLDNMQFALDLLGGDHDSALQALAEAQAGATNTVGGGGDWWLPENFG